MSFWLYVTLGVFAVASAAFLFFASRKSGDPSTYELGQISEQWMSQHRAHARDSER